MASILCAPFSSGDDSGKARFGIAPINWFLFGLNALVLGLSVFAVAKTFEIFHEAESDFVFNSMMNTEPKPCGIATPDIYLLYQGLGIISTGPFSVPQRNKWASDLRQTMCSARRTGAVTTQPFQVRALTLGLLLNNDTLYPYRSKSWPTADEGPKASENHTVGHLCTQSFKDGQPGSFNSKLYGDLVERVSRAYLAAMPAFFRLDTSTRYPSGVDAEGCMGSKNPFHDDEQNCPHLATIQSELRKAGTTAQSALMVGYHPFLSGAPLGATPENDVDNYYAHSMPRVDEMLYRLLALSVVSQYDRTENAASCFRKTNAAEDARQMCERIYGAAASSYTLGSNTVTLSEVGSGSVGTVGGPFGVNGAEAGLPTLKYKDGTTGDADMEVEFETYQHRVATMVPRERRTRIKDGNNNHILKDSEIAAVDDTNVYGGDVYPQAKTCHMEFRDYTSFSPPSPPANAYLREDDNAPKAPPSAPYITATDESGEQVRRAVVEACTHNHQWGRWDQARLFGIPDVVMPFVRGPIEEASYNVRNAGDSILNDFYTNSIKRGGAEGHPKFEMRVWTAFRLALTTIWASILLPTLGFLIGGSIVPASVQFAIHLLGATTETKGFQKTVLRPENRSKFFWVALFVGIFAIIWVLLVDPSHQAPYPRDDVCNDFLSHAYGGPYVTTHSRENFLLASDWIVGWTTLFVLLISLAYNITKPSSLSYIMDKIRQVKREDRKGAPYNERISLFVFFVCLLIIIMGAVLAGLRGAEWLEEANNDAFSEDKKQTDWLRQECYCLLWVTFLQGIGLGSLTQRWAVADMKEYLIVPWVVSNAVLLGAPLIVRNQVFYGEGSNPDIDIYSSEEPGIGTLVTFEYIFAIVAASAVIVNGALAYRAAQKRDSVPPGKDKEAAEAVAVNSSEGMTSDEFSRKSENEYIQGVREQREREAAEQAARRRAEVRRSSLRQQGVRLKPIQEEESYAGSRTGRLTWNANKAGYLPMIKLPV